MGLNTVALNNDTTAEKTLVNEIESKLGALEEENYDAFRQLVMKCNCPSGDFSGDALDMLKASGLIKDDGSIDETTKNIIISSVVSLGGALLLINPIKGAVIEDLKSVLALNGSNLNSSGSIHVVLPENEGYKELWQTLSPDEQDAVKLSIQTISKTNKEHGKQILAMRHKRMNPAK